ncbi:hypothetical protein HY992_01390 [Candidatus Micrarchaeota archaeon]|nr:hypothetical protein [Candidatus Micrarchaeota archaeon]
MAFIDFVAAGVPIFLFTLVPGLALALPLLKRTNLSFFQIICYGFMLGLIIPPLALWFLSFFGVKYSFDVAIGVSLALTLAGIALSAKEKVEVKPSFELKRDGVWIVLTVIMALAFFIRIQSLSATYYEFDPYYYDVMQEQILTKGEVLRYDDLAWYPHRDSHRNPPLIAYLTSQWYSIYAQGGAYDHMLLSTVAAAYPPLVGALLCFLMFELVALEYRREIGLIAAGLVAFTPQLMEKFLAGVSEQLPWGIFAAFFFYAAYAHAVKHESRRFAVLAAVALASVSLGSKAQILAYLVFAGYVGVQAVIDYFNGKMSKQFIEVNAIVLFGAIVGEYGLMAYSPSGIQFTIPTELFPMAGALAGACALYLISEKTKKLEEKLNYFIALAVVGLVFLLMPAIGPIPSVGSTLAEQLSRAVGYAKPDCGLAQTVAEEGATGGGWLAGFTYNAFVYLSVPINELGVNSLYLFLFGGLASLAYAIKNGSRVGVLYAVAIIPISYVGINKIKYLVHFGFMLVLAFASFIGGIQQLAKEYFENPKKNEEKQYAVYAAVGMLALALLYIAGRVSWSVDVALAVATGILALAACAFAVDSVVRKDKTSAFVSIAGVAFVFLLLQSSLMLPIFSAAVNYNSVNGSNWGELMTFCGTTEGMARQIYCNRIPPYWSEPMEWIEQNVEDDARVLHWWDYGHWTNFFGRKKTVTRNDHAHMDMDLEVADKMVANTPEGMAKFMRQTKAKYLLLDYDLIGKWGALTYLSCYRNNETKCEIGPGKDECDTVKYMYERVFIPKTPQLNDFCETEDGGKGIVGYSPPWTNYCVRAATDSTGGTIMLLYNQDGTVNRAAMFKYGEQELEGRPFDQYILWYPKEWIDGSNALEDAKSEYYESMFYQGFFLGEIPGFEQVYPNYNQQGPSAAVRIFKLKDETAADVQPLPQVN